MGDQYISLPQGPNALLVQGEDHTIRPTASLEALDLWDQCLLEWSPYCLSITYSQVRLERTGALAAADCYLPNPHRKRLRLLWMQVILHRVKTDRRPDHSCTHRFRVQKRHLQLFPKEISMRTLVTSLGLRRNATLVLNITR